MVTIPKLICNINPQPAPPSGTRGCGRAPGPFRLRSRVLSLFECFAPANVLARGFRAAPPPYVSCWWPTSMTGAQKTHFWAPDHPACPCEIPKWRKNTPPAPRGVPPCARSFRFCSGPHVYPRAPPIGCEWCYMAAQVGPHGTHGGLRPRLCPGDTPRVLHAAHEPQRGRTWRYRAGAGWCSTAVPGSPI